MIEFRKSTTNSKNFDISINGVRVRFNVCATDVYFLAPTINAGVDADEVQDAAWARMNADQRSHVARAAFLAMDKLSTNC